MAKNSSNLYNASWNLFDNIDFYEKSNILLNIIARDDIDNFYKYMEENTNIEVIASYITKNKMEISEDLFKINFVKTVAAFLLIYPYKNITKIEILITDYGFVLDKNFLECGRNYCTMDLLILFHKYFDLAQYINEIANIFQKICFNISIDGIKQFITMGFNITDLINLTNDNKYEATVWYAAIENEDPDILKYLLEQNVNFKKHELEMVKQCVDIDGDKHLKLLINYGVNLEFLNIVPNERTMNIYNLLASNGLGPEKIITLFTSEK